MLEQLKPPPSAYAALYIICRAGKGISIDDFQDCLREYGLPMYSQKSLKNGIRYLRSTRPKLVDEKPMLMDARRKLYYLSPIFEFNDETLKMIHYNASQKRSINYTAVKKSGVVRKAISSAPKNQRLEPNLDKKPTVFRDGKKVNYMVATITQASKITDFDML